METSFGRLFFFLSDNITLCLGTREEIDFAKQLIDAEIMTEIDIRRRREHRKVSRGDELTIF